MKFSIITPTLERPSLARCKRSVEIQTFRDFEHIVQVDPHTGDFGNHARWLACQKATGDYLIWLDDDNFLNGPHVLQSIYDSMEGASNPAWALFPIYRHGSYFLLEPPGMCQTDSANIVVQRSIGDWPDIESREADGVLAERLLKYPYVAFPNVLPIVVMEVSSNGQ